MPAGVPGRERKAEKAISPYRKSGLEQWRQN
jgi:hypothetical protein